MHGGLQKQPPDTDAKRHGAAHLPTTARASASGTTCRRYAVICRGRVPLAGVRGHSSAIRGRAHSFPGLIKVARLTKNGAAKRGGGGRRGEQHGWLGKGVFSFFPPFCKSSHLGAGPRGEAASAVAHHLSPARNEPPPSHPMPTPSPRFVTSASPGGSRLEAHPLSRASPSVLASPLPLPHFASVMGT